MFDDCKSKRTLFLRAVCVYYGKTGMCIKSDRHTFSWSMHHLRSIIQKIVVFVRPIKKQKLPAAKTGAASVFHAGKTVISLLMFYICLLAGNFAAILS